MKTCTGCGAELPEDAVFCPHCARRISPEQVPVPALAALYTISDVKTISDVETISPGEAPRPTAMLRDGEQFDGRYTIERQIGAGAMGVVYAAHDQITSRRVALKLINPALADKPASRERFLREGLMARDVRHANVVAMYDVGDANGQIYLVMEYLGGETLRAWLHRTIRSGVDIPFDTARSIIRKVLQGLAAAHATNVIHRDLKPENIVLTGDPEAGDFSLKILDFGIARAVGQSASRHVTTTAASTGTPLYMAPEQKTAADTVGPAADVYAVTAMLYELLMGVAPEGRWRPPSQERSDVPSAVDAIVEKGLASRPRSRYQTADEYLNALSAVNAAPASKAESVSVPKDVSSPPATPQQLSQPGQWLKWRSPAWELWKRMSTRTRYVVAGVFAFILLGVIGNSMDSSTIEPPPDSNRQQPFRREPPSDGQPPHRDLSDEGHKPDPDPPRTTPAIDISGRWYSPFPGTSIVAAVTALTQRGNQVRAETYDANGFHTGRLSGEIDGNIVTWDGQAINGMRVTGRAVVAADGRHMSVEEGSPATGVLRYVTHKDHIPH